MHYGRYQIIKEVGRGSMGVVFQALDPQIDRLVAVKVLRTDCLESAGFVQRFLNEAKVIGRLTHPNIIAIHDVGEEEGAVYIAMEYLEGMSLSEVVKGRKPNAIAVVALGVQLAETLDYAHQKGVVHRDIKPSNIIVQTDGQIKITDFGIAHLDGSTATLKTQTGEVMGTPAYMSPEQVLSRAVDGRSDIFSLGVILYELITGRRPFGAGSRSLVNVFNDIVQITPPEPSSIIPGLPRELSRLIMKSLQKNPAKRFQSGREFAEALRLCLIAPVPPPSVTLPKRAWYVAWLMGSVVLAAAAVVVDANSPRPKIPPVPAARTAAKARPAHVEPSILPLAAPAPMLPAPSLPLVPAPPRRQFSADPSNGNLPAARTLPLPAYADKGEAPGVRTPEGNLPAKTVSLIAGQSSGTGGKAPAAHRQKRFPPVEPSAVARPQLPAQGQRVGALPGGGPASSAKPMAKFAFLKVGSSPPGADVYIDGSLKGTTPLMMKLDLGQYRVRLMRSGYRDTERAVNLQKMQEYPLLENLQPVK